MKNVTFLYLFLCVLVSCESAKDNIQIKSEIVAIEKSDKTNSRSDSENTDSDNLEDEKLLFTGDDIAWFNPKTRELRFKNITPSLTALPIYAQFDINIGNETLFSATHINFAVNRAYDDLVLIYDIGNYRYFFQDCYPYYWDPESTQRNREKRAPGWNKFINRLKVEGKIK